MAWQLQEAKQRLSEVVRLAEAEGPQAVTRHGEEVAVIVSMAEWRAATEHKPSLIDYILDGPDMSMLDLTRSAELPREIDLSG